MGTTEIIAQFAADCRRADRARAARLERANSPRLAAIIARNRRPTFAAGMPGGLQVLAYCASRERCMREAAECLIAARNLREFNKDRGKRASAGVVPWLAKAAAMRRRAVA